MGELSSSDSLPSEQSSGGGRSSSPTTPPSPSTPHASLDDSGSSPNLDTASLQPGEQEDDSYPPSPTSSALRFRSPNAYSALPTQPPLPTVVVPPSALLMSLKTRYRNYQALAFGLTFLSYCMYHAGRQPYSTAKSALAPNPNSTSTTHEAAGYAPFNDGAEGVSYLGALDTTFLVAYAVGMFIAGPLGDRVNIRLFLGVGMIGSGVFLGMIGMYYYFGVHSVVLWGITDFIAGIFQATGWPGCVVVITRWFDRRYMGTVMGVWNAHSSVGNLLGKYAGAGLQDALGWQWNYLGVALMIVASGVVMLLFLQPRPDAVFTEEEIAQVMADKEEEHQAALARKAGRAVGGEYQDVDSLSLSSPPPLEIDPLASSSRPLPSHPTAAMPPAAEQYKPFPFMKALLIPGVLEFSFALFFSKLTTYALIFWLPFYLTRPPLNYSDLAATNISTAFDFGGIVGGVVSGWWSDWNGKRGWVSFLMSMACIPAVGVYIWLGGYGTGLNVILLFIIGVMVNGPYTLISSAVCADLGNHPSLKGNPLAMSTVTGIIDGFGSIGACLQGELVGWVSDKYGWNSVFYALMLFSLLCCLSMGRVVKHELFGQGGTATYGVLKEEPEVAMAGDDEMKVDSDEMDDRLTHTTGSDYHTGKAIQ